MKFPEKNSRSEKILKAYFIHGPMTIYQGAEVHGSFPHENAPDGIEHHRLERLYIELVERGCLDREGIKYKLSDEARRKLVAMSAGPATAGEVVPPRTAGPWRVLSLARLWQNSPYRFAL